jgi:hypothetical protein
MLYMFLLYWNPESPVSTPEEAIAQHFALADELRARGAYVSSEALGAQSATTVRVREGKTLITDGPYLETKEVMGGYYILDCRDLDEALEIAGRFPDAYSSGVEVRPVMHVPGWDYGASSDWKRAEMVPSG